MVASAVAASGCMSPSGLDDTDECQTTYYRQLMGTLQLVVMPLDSTYLEWDQFIAVHDSIDLDAVVRPVIGLAPGADSCRPILGAEVLDDIQYSSSDEAIATVHRWQGTVFARSAGLVDIKVRAAVAGIERDVGFLVY
jgi:hypothetical protein